MKMSNGSHRNSVKVVFRALRALKTPSGVPSAHLGVMNKYSIFHYIPLIISHTFPKETAWKYGTVLKESLQNLFRDQF